MFMMRFVIVFLNEYEWMNEWERADRSALSLPYKEPYSMLMMSIPDVEILTVRLFDIRFQYSPKLMAPTSMVQEAGNFYWSGRCKL